ncbi:hypothetical protein BDP27DRAFT_461189 [Rhodocollybia butyracea]|uniref:Uncharacterized protein n=1 Tax=Rhodocollybia butyracea TaxID=206335 RepID=A0A9P5Q0T6_9AGAR|nr:hypothetical protein BDP27DRAFT_461189 [Rhodocollybia butyracea]
MFPSLEQPLQVAGIRLNYSFIRSHLPWGKKKTNTSVKKEKSITRQRSDHRLNRDPSERELRCPPRFPRKRIGEIHRQSSSFVRRAAELRAQRVSVHKSFHKKEPALQKKKPVRQPCRRPYRYYCGPKIKPETPQDKIDFAYKEAQQKLPKPHTFEDTIFVQQMRELKIRNRILTENFNHRVVLDELEKTAGERLKQQAEHDSRAEQLRAKLQRQFQELDRTWTLDRPPLDFGSTPKRQPRYSKPRTLAEVSPTRTLEQQARVVQQEAAQRVHQARIDRGELPPDAPMPVKDTWSRWEEDRAGMENAYAEVLSARRREAAARAEERLSHEQRRLAQIRAAWHERMERETALTEALKVAQEAKARDAAREQTRRAAAAPKVNPTPAAAPKIPAPKQYAWELYESKWAVLNGGTGADEVEAAIPFLQMPWPQFLPVNSLDDFNADDISSFLLCTTRPGYQTQFAKQRLRQTLLLYHPDKFNPRVLPYVREEDRVLVAAGASRVTVIIHKLLQVVAGCRSYA